MTLEEYKLSVRSWHEGRMEALLYPAHIKKELRRAREKMLLISRALWKKMQRDLPWLAK